MTDFEFADDDLKKPGWVKIRDIEINEGVANVKGRPIRNIHVEMPEKAVMEANNQKITEISQGVWKDQDAIRSRCEQKLTSLVGSEAEKKSQRNFWNKT